MSDPWWKRRKKKAPWLNDIYDELEKLGEIIDETMQKAFDNSSKAESSRKTHSRGFSIKVGPDGKPKIRELHRSQTMHVDADLYEGDYEPLIDFLEEEKCLVVLAQLPGISKDNIDLRITETWLTITIDSKDFEWYDELKLPIKINPKSARASYKNGVLEVKIQKSKKIDNKISIKK